MRPKESSETLSLSSAAISVRDIVAFNLNTHLHPGYSNGLDLQSGLSGVRSLLAGSACQHRMGRSEFRFQCCLYVAADAILTQAA